MTLGQDEQVSVEGMESQNSGDAQPGEQLRNARLALGLSVSDVSTRLKLSVNKIEALEQGESTVVAAPVFVAGYLRSYARLLELSEDDVLASFSILPALEPSVDDGGTESLGLGETSSGGIISSEFPSESSGAMFAPLKLLVVIVLVGLVAVAVYVLSMDAGSDDDVQVSEETDAISDSIQSLPEIAVQESRSISGPALKPNDTEDVLVSDVSDAKITDDESSVVDELIHDEVVVNDLPKSSLKLIINDESWVDVTDSSGERLIYRLAKPGLSRAVTGVAPFDVQLGYAPGVEIFYNGASYDMSRYASRRSARFRVGKAGDQMTDE